MTTDNAMTELTSIIGDDKDLQGRLQKAVDSAQQGQVAGEFCLANDMAKGVGGYIYHTLPVVVQIVLRYANDYEQAISEAVACGGDTDTVGAGTGMAGIPQPWLKGLKDWPRTNNWIARLGDDLARSAWFKRWLAANGGSDSCLAAQPAFHGLGIGARVSAAIAAILDTRLALPFTHK